MKILEKLGLAPQKKLDDLVQVVGKMVDVVVQLTDRLIALEEAVRAMQPKPSLLGCGLCGRQHVEIPCPYLHLTELEEELVALLQGPPEKECDGRPCTCGSTDQEFEEHVQEETRSAREVPADDALRTGSEGEPRQTCNCCHGCEYPTHDKPKQDYFDDGLPTK